MNEREIKLSGQLEKYKENFIAAMDDDLNTADAIAALFEMVREINANITATSNSSVTIMEFAANMLKELGDVLGILQKSQKDTLDAEVEQLIAKRQQARKDKNWALADSIRDQLKDMGIVLEDTPQGIKWRRA
jgi:cysteinyl-tRNA synthetase